MTWVFYLACVFGAYVGMEFIAWFTHKYLMHGLLWNWHEDHHKPHLKEGFFEKTIDSFWFLQFLVPFVTCLVPTMQTIDSSSLSE